MPNAEETDAWLKQVFTAPSTSSLADSYNSWSARYEADMLAVGYMHPLVAAGMVGRHVVERDGGILDAGVGTGLLGQVLAVMGYHGLVGIDMAEGMLTQARSRNVYTRLSRQVLGEPLDFADDSFAAVVSIGTLNIGHAPPAALDELVRVTRPGGHLILTIPVRAWEQGGFGEKVEALARDSRWRLVEATEPYRPMPLSPAEGATTTRMLVYRSV